MKARTALLACVACFLAGAADTGADGGFDVTYASGLLTIRCTEAPLAEVLEQVGAATGMELVLDEAIKGTLLTAEIEAQPMNVAVERLLEGSGVSYAMSLSPDGQQVSRMYVGSEAGAKARGMTCAAPRPAPRCLTGGGRKPGPLILPAAPAVPSLLTRTKRPTWTSATIRCRSPGWLGAPAGPASVLSPALSVGGQSSVPTQPRRLRPPTRSQRPRSASRRTARPPAGPSTAHRR
jgi:hypothetical protein